nr:HAD family phosphatase [Kineococcus siccus]
MDAVTCVLCDADGNLFPSEEPAFVASTDVTNRFLAEHGVERRYTAEELRLATTGLNFRSTAIALAVEHGVGVADDVRPAGAAAAPAGSAPVLDAAALQAWVEAEAAAVTAHLRTALRPDPDVLEPLTAIGRAYDVAAVSSSADGRIAACFEVTGLAGFFPPERRFSAEDSLPRPTSKPDPAIYRFAGERLDIGPGRAVAVEDSVPGATSAVRAGWPTIGNLQFVPADERAEREAALQAVGVLTVVSSWWDVLDLLPRTAPAAPAAG